MSTNNAVNSPLSGTTGTGNFVGSNNPSITTGFNDSNGNRILTFSPTASSVNYLQFYNAATGNAPNIGVNGSDSNIPLILSTIGTGGVIVKGTGTNDNASAGNVGEFVSSIVSGPGNNINSATSTNLTSISLTAGDWDLEGNIYFSPSVTITNANVWISTTSATPPDVSLRNQLSGIAAAAVGMSAPFIRLSLSTTTTVYITGNVTLSAGTCTQAGGIYARRRR